MSKSQSSTSNDGNKPQNNLNPIAEQFTTVLNTLSSFKSQISMLSAQVKALEKSVKKQMKQLQREAQKIKIKEIERHLVLLSLQKSQMIYANLWENLKDLKWQELK